MNAWPSQGRDLQPWRRVLGARRGLDLLLVPFLGALLLVRALTDDLSAPNSRHTGSLNLSGLIAIAFILVAGGLLLRRRHGLRATVLSAAWLCVWTAIAVNTSGASTETLREGVREASVVALAVIIYNARGAVTVSVATRLVQLMGVVPAVIALYQLATFTGVHRAYGTFAHPDTGAMFFTIATVASLWLYLDDGRRWYDALLTTLFAVALIATFSIDGLATLVAMLMVFGALRPGSLRAKLGPYAMAAVIVIAFFASPLGARRIANESSSRIGATGEPDSSLAWRLKKWKMLIPEWESSPAYGQGLGTTTTAEGPPGNVFISKPPHNEYIRYLVETGVLGLAILLVAVALLVRNLWRRRRIPGTLDAGTFNAPLLALTITAGCLVNSLADNTLLASPTGYAAALIIIAVLALPAGVITRPGRQQSS
jgi:O-antigen ligase